jgi:hypothetical protein
MAVRRPLGGDHWLFSAPPNQHFPADCSSLDAAMPKEAALKRKK